MLKETEICFSVTSYDPSSSLTYVHHLFNRIFPSAYLPGSDIHLWLYFVIYKAPYKGGIRQMIHLFIMHVAIK